MTRKERVESVIAWFEEHQPVAETELNYHDPFSLLVAVVLSAQCTDKRVNMVTPALLEAYPDPHAMSLAEPEELFPYIRSISYPNNKSKHLAGLARKLYTDFAGEVPSDLKDLQSLPGVGRKTANVIASIIFDQPAMAVDTHVFRVSERIGLSYRAKTPLDTEKQLVQYIPDHLIPKAHHWIILHGRYVCVARNPKCHECGLIDLCKFVQKKYKKK